MNGVGESSGTQTEEEPKSKDPEEEPKSKDPDEIIPLNSRRLASLLAALIVGVLGTALVMTQVPYQEEFRPAVAEVKETAQWVTWVVILSLQLGIYLALAGPVWKAIWPYKNEWRWAPAAHVGTIVALIFLPLASIAFFGSSHSVQEAFRPRILLVASFGSLVASMAATAVVRTQQEISKRFATVTTTDAAQDAEYLRLRKSLILLGSILALFVTLAVLAAGAQRNSLLARETAVAAHETVLAQTTSDAAKNVHLRRAAAATARGARYGVELVWIYGLYYSFVLVLVYMPAHRVLTAAGQSILEKHNPLPLPDDLEYEALKKRHDAMKDRLQLSTGGIASLKPAALVLFPLISSLASAILGDVKVGVG